MICWSSPSRPTRRGSARTRRFSTSPCRRRTWPNSTRWIAPRAPARPVNATSGGGPCGAPVRSSRFGGLRERGEGEGNAVARGHGAVGDLGWGVAAEAVVKPGNAVREELPRLGDPRPPVDRDWIEHLEQAAVPSDTRLLDVLVVRLCADQNLARQNLARMASATSSGLRSIKASPQMR